MTAAVIVRGLKKSYGGRPVLDGIDLDIKKGEIFALLGSNGAGKTTALECIEGLRKFDGGTVRLYGRTGVQLQSSSLPSHIKPMEAARLFAAWNHAPLDTEMLDAFGIRALRKKYCELSTGQKRRLHLALALINNPDIVFLDEPTAGLDVEARVMLHDQIRKLKSMGKTVVLASHDMAEVEALCDRIAVLRGGNIAFSGTLGELTEKTGSFYSVRVKTNRDTITLETKDIVEALTGLFEDLRRENVSVVDINVNRGTLEQHFMAISGREVK